MLKAFFKTAWRNFMKHRLVSGINLFGLTIGITCCLLILTYILHELSYDRYNENAKNIYRVTRTFNNQDGVVSLTLSTIAPPFGPLLVNDFPEIKKLTRLIDYSPAPLKYGEKLFNENHVFFADENLFDVFSVKVLEGNPHTALRDPFSVMMTEEMARKYFGNENPMNKMIRFNNQLNFKMTGIFKEFPSNAHFHPGILLSFNSLKDTALGGEEQLRTNYGNNSFFNYILLPDNYNTGNMISRFPAFLDKHMPASYYNGGKPSQFTSLGLQKLTDIHLRSHTDYEAEENGDINRVYIFSAIALFILLIACINYMNLSTARSALRAREIGIRKVIGARKKELITQFLSESVLLTWLATLLAFSLLFLSVPLMNRLTGLTMSPMILLRWEVIVPLLIFPFFIGTLSGLYPALVMSSFQPIKTLKGLFRMEGNSISFRKALVVFQFAISIILLITTAVVFQQLKYMQDKSLGYDKDRVLDITYNNALDSKYEAFRNTLLGQSNIRQACRSSRIPTGRLLDNMGAYTMSGDSMRPSKTDVKYVATDYDFQATYGFGMKAGRYFSRAFGTDTSGFVLNESAILALGWKDAQSAVGAPFKYGNITGKIIGVCNDFHFESLHQKIGPMIFILLPPNQNYYNHLSVKIGGQDLPQTLAFIENTWRNFVPGIPYEGNFLDEQFSKLYSSEQKQGSIFTGFAMIAIFIACLGLLGLSAFAISQRVKEIGIRKVLGASVGNVVAILSKDFLMLVAVSLLISLPVVRFVANHWLENYPYRINMSWILFASGALLVVCIALATVSFQALRAAVSNPVKSLRSE